MNITQLAKQWINDDPCKETRDAVSNALNNENEIKRMFSSELTFGTSGLRAAMGPGPVCMNDLVVIRAAQGIANFLVRTFSLDELQRRSVVIGFDHRVCFILLLSKCIYV